MNRYIYSLLILVFFSLFAINLFAQDTVVVQTLSFDSITSRQGIYKFPDNPENFRKIIMTHTLKCDPRTAQDKYNCGEWDYLTYSLVYKPTGKMDSTAAEAPLYRIGWESPDTINYTTKSTHSIFQKNKYSFSMKLDSNEKVFNYNTTSENLNLTGKFFRLQFMITSRELKDSGYTKGNLDKIRIFLSSMPATLKNFTLRMKSAPPELPSSFINSGFEIYYQGDINLTSGWNDINLFKSFSWSGFGNFLFDISFEYTELPILSFYGNLSKANGFFTSSAIEDKYLEFDGVNDNVDCGVFNELLGTNKFTYETWVRVDEWEAWNNILGVGNTNLIELGGESGQLYCIIRNTDNTHGNSRSAITLGEWTHLAMVYDGSQATNESKLKLFVNGEQRTLTYSGNIPSKISLKPENFYINSALYSQACMKGAIDEVRIWNDAVDSTTISKWFNKKAASSHPYYNKLLAYYSMDNQKFNDKTLTDESPAKKYNGTMIGMPKLRTLKTTDLNKDVLSTPAIPNIAMQFVRGNFTRKLDSTIVADTLENSMMTISKYKIVNRQPIIESTQYGYKTGYTYAYSPSGKKIDSVNNPIEKTIINSKLKYFNEPFEIKDVYEIGRYITPYGINLDLGPDGFQWSYDVTDYAPLLKGNVEFSDGNQQELIDVKFLFIKGTAPRDVISITRPWGTMRSVSYASLSDNTNLKDTLIKLNPLSKQFKMKTRLTGHGHNSNDGNYPHCCEWKDNVHTLFANDQKAGEWHIFQYDDCALNPVFPQGGTWPGSREGWCPGDVVKDYEFDLNKLIVGNSVKLDYDISKVPENNKGMGGGNYVVNMDLIEYGDYKFNKDIEIYEVVIPSDNPYYSRKNPICSNPIVVVRNNGRDEVKSIIFEYYVSGGKKEIFNWNGSIKSNETKQFSFPINSRQFWIGDGTNKFYINAKLDDTNIDDNPENNTFMTTFKMPDLYEENIVLWYQTNKRPGDYTYEVYDINDKLVFSKNNLAAETTYKDTLNLPNGCYTFKFIDKYNMGLSYWAYTDQGNGFIQVRNKKGALLKSFNPDCGNGYNYSFNIGDFTSVQEPGLENIIQAFPNPAEQNVRIAVNYPMGFSKIEIVDVLGNVIFRDKALILESYEFNFPTAGLNAGSYFIRISNESMNITNKFIKK